MKESKPYRVVGSIIDTIFLQERFVLPFTPINFRFTLNSNELFIQTGEPGKYIYEVLNCKLHTTYCKVNNSVKLEIERGLSTRDAKYHMRAPLVRIWSLPRHVIDWEVSSIFCNEKLPSILIAGLALTSSIHGDLSK